MCSLEFYHSYTMVGGDEMKVKEETTMGSTLGEAEEEEVKLLTIEEIRDIKKRSGRKGGHTRSFGPLVKKMHRYYLVGVY